MKKLELTFLGQPDFKIGNESISNLVLRKGLALVAFLAVTKKAHSREALAGLLWGEMTEENARRNLRVALTKLRRHFDDYLIIQRRSVAFDVDSDYWLDVDTFEHHLNQPNPSVDQLQTAVDLYHGPFLADLPLRDAPLFEEWVRPYQERLRQMAMDSLYRLAVVNTQQQQYAQGIDNLGKLLILEPWMEEAHRQLMLLLALSGQRSAALAQFETCQAVLDEELGVEPSEATIELYEKILKEEIATEDSQVVAAAQTTPHLIPFQAPAEKKNFIGRAALMNDIGKALIESEQSTIHALVGMGGIGKSTVATEIAHNMRAHFVDGVLWANAATSEPMSILESWAQLYGYDFSRITDIESMSAAYRSVLADKCVLLILDDVTSITRIKPLLPTGSACAVLLTTRDHDLARGLDAHVWLMRELSAENGRLLLTSILGKKRVNNEFKAVSDICTLLENLPLAIEIIAQRLKSRPRRRLADVAQRLQDETHRLSELQISDRAVRASFAISYQSLDAQLKRMFALMGLFNGRSFTADALASIAELNRYDTEDRIFALTALSLAQEEGQMRYKQHALLADFALEKLGDEGEVEYGRFAEYYLQFAQEHQHNYDALRPEWDNMMAAIKTAFRCNLWQITIDFTDALKEAWFARGRYAQARQGFIWTDKASRKLDDEASLALNYLRWGEVCIEQGDYDEAEKLLKYCKEIYQRLGDEIGVSDAQYHQARILLEHKKKYGEANELLQASQLIQEKQDNGIGIARILYRRARIFQYANFDKRVAEQLANEALMIQTQVEDNRGMSATLRLLAQLALADNDFNSAHKYAEKALHASQIIQDQGELMAANYALCGITRLEKEYDLAYEYAEAGLSLARLMGLRRWQALFLLEMTWIAINKLDSKRALQTNTESYLLFQELGDDFNLVYSEINFGTIFKQLGQIEDAIFKWAEAEKLAKKINHTIALELIEKRLNALENR